MNNVTHSLKLIGVRQSPIASPEKTSPNKSPPHPAMKGFNPNAPSFVPMALQPGPRPNVVCLSLLDVKVIVRDLCCTWSTIR